MNTLQKKLLREHLLDPGMDFNQKLKLFITIFNADISGPDFPSEKWNISGSDWQRYEFLGDRVLNLVAADYFYHHPASEREGQMTKKMGIVSNESLTEIIERKKIDIALLIPEIIGQQKTYGEKVTGGALEAFIGVLYDSIGFEGTKTFILDFLSDEIDQHHPENNFIGKLQEWHQHQGLPLPVYSEIPEKRDGPVHSPLFTFRVCAAEGAVLGEGTGRNVTAAKQDAARKALEKLRIDA
ncbi:MAG TPA: ribonuclease III domain-containing protein [Methanoregula sp.]|nr:ribonuclease III domain-containing protein [Methanoregula sp.]